MAHVIRDCTPAIKQILHDYGIHSVTVQPEYHDDDSVFRAKRKASTMSASVSSGGAMAGAQSDNGAAHESTMTMTAPCLLRCTDEDCEPAECCPSDVVMEWRRGSVVTMGAATSSAIVGLTVVSQRSPSPAAHDGRNSP